MENTDRIVDASVRLAAERCLELFSSAIEATRSARYIAVSSEDVTGPDNFQLTAERYRFCTWSANVSAFADGRASLDYRLRQLPEELDLVRSLIDTICSRLQAYTSAINETEETLKFEGTELNTDQAGRCIPANTENPCGKREPNKENVEFPKRKVFNYEKAMEAIHTSNGWLHRLSNLLRKASVINQNIHAQSYKPPGIDADGLITFFTWVVARDFPGLSKQLKSRMSRTMVERYRRILYRRDRYSLGWKQQMDFQKKTKLPSERPTETELPSKHDRTPTPGTSKQETLKACVVQETSTLLSKMSATEPDRSRYYTPSTISTARSAALSHTAEELLPTAPIACQTERNFTCEFCCMILPSKTGTDAALWSKHVKQDLDSYVCLFDRCNHPDNLYSSAAEWLHHIRSEHLLKWICPAEGDEIVEFGSPEDLEQHINKSHPGMFDAEMLPYIMDACRETAEVVFEACPFCDQPPRNNIEVHISHHLQYLALKSLPWTDSGGNHNGKESEPLSSTGSFVDRETLGLSIGSLQPGSLHLGNDICPVASEYGDEFLTSEEQKAAARPEWVQSSIGDDCQAEWGFISKITIRHEKWRAFLHAQSLETAAEEVTARLDHKDPEVRYATIKVIAGHGPLLDRVLVALAARLDDEDSDVRHAAVKALGGREALLSEVLTALVAVLNDEDSDVRHSAIKAIGKQEALSNEVLVALAARLDDEDSDVRHAAVKVLGGREALPNEVLVALAARLHDEDSDVRHAAVKALGGREALPSVVLMAVAALLNDKDLDVRHAVVKALGGREALPGEVLTALVAVLNDEDSDVRHSAIKAIGKQEALSNEVLVALAARLYDEDLDVRHAAVKALGGREALPSVVLMAVAALLNDKDLVVRHAVVKALGEREALPGEVLTALAAVLNDEDLDVRHSAIKAIGKREALPNKVLIALVALLDDKDSDVRHAAVKALGGREALPSDGGGGAA